MNAKEAIKVGFDYFKANASGVSASVKVGDHRLSLACGRASQYRSDKCEDTYYVHRFVLSRFGYANPEPDGGSR